MEALGVYVLVHTKDWIEQPVIKNILRPEQGQAGSSDRAVSKNGDRQGAELMGSK